MLYRLNKYLLHYNFFISLCSIALVLHFSIVTDTKVPFSVYGLTFFGTLCIYNLFRQYPTLKDYFKTASSFGFELILYSLVLCGIFYLLLPGTIKLLYIIPAVLSIAYKFPLFDKDLRSLPYLKVFIIAAVWILIGAIPVLNSTISNDHTTKTVILSMISQFFFFIAITIPFDVFDVEKDKMKTLATGMGTRRAILIAKTCLVVHLIVVILKTPSCNEMIAHSIVAIITFTILSLYKYLQSRSMQYYCVDGLIILQTIIIYFLN